MLRVARVLLFAVHSSLLVARSLLLVVYCVCACCLVFYCLLFVVWNSLFVSRCLICCFLSVVRCVLFGVRWLLFAGCLSYVDGWLLVES